MNKTRSRIENKEYFAQIERVLYAKHQVLLFCRAAAGKTVLAITFAKHLQEHAGYRIGYRDVRQAEAGDGRKWYALGREHDSSGTLYILDNWHLAPREVSEFCRQWKDSPPKHAQCMLISRMDLHETYTEETAYLQVFADDEKIMVRSEDIFLRVIELLHFALLLHHARSIDATCLPALLAPLHGLSVLQSALEKSSVHGIQLFVFNVASIDTSYLLLIQQGLQDVHIVEKFGNASARDIGLLLWNI